MVVAVADSISTVTLPASPKVGDQVMLFLTNWGCDGSLNANTGQQIWGPDSSSAGLSAAPQSVSGVSTSGGNTSYPAFIVATYVGSQSPGPLPTWSITTMGADDIGYGLTLLGQIDISGGLYVNRKSVASTKTANYTTTYQDCALRLAGASVATLTLTSGLTTTGQVIIAYNASTHAWNLATTSGTVDYPTIPPKSTVIIQQVQTNVWQVLARVGLSDTSNANTPTNPAMTSGSALQPSTVNDVELMIPVTAGATLPTVQITYGPTTGAENTIVPASSPLPASALSLFRVRIRRGWRIVVTVGGTGTSIGTVTQQDI